MTEAHDNASADAILDTALLLAEQSSWERLTLAAVAEKLQIPLAAVHAHYPQKDDLVEGWFDRADRRMLDRAADLDRSAPPEERIHHVIMSWLEALAPHRRLTGEMLMYKLEPGHVHLQAQGITRISRTVQWFREAAGLRGTHLSRIVGELGLTGCYLQTFARWLGDDSSNTQATRRFLERQLALAAPFLR